MPEDRMVIPPNETKVTPPTVKKPKGRAITIKKGDTLTRLAKVHGTTVAALAKANGIKDPSKIKAGARIHVPPGLKAAPGIIKKPGQMPPGQYKKVAPKPALRGGASPKLPRLKPFPVPPSSGYRSPVRPPRTVTPAPVPAPGMSPEPLPMPRPVTRPPALDSGSGMPRLRKAATKTLSRGLGGSVAKSFGK